MLWYCDPYNFLASARIVDVFPVPGGPYSSKWGSLFSFVKRSTGQNNPKYQIKSNKKYFFFFNFFVEKRKKDGILKSELGGLTSIDDIAVGGDVGERLGAVLLDPRGSGLAVSGGDDRFALVGNRQRSAVDLHGWECFRHFDFASLTYWTSQPMWFWEFWGMAPKPSQEESFRGCGERA